MIRAALLLALLPSVAFAESGAILEKIRATGQITVGVREASAPFNFIDDHGQNAGFGWEISQRIVAQIKDTLQLPALEVKTFILNPQTRVALIANRTVDLECSSTTNNEQRQHQVAFSDSYFIVGTRLLTRKDSGINDFDDLRGKRVVVEAGTTSERLLRQLNSAEKMNIDILLSKDTAANFMTVETGRATASMGDDIMFHGNIATASDPSAWKVTGVPRTYEAYGCMMGKGDPEFKAIADKVIAGMQTSGEMRVLYDKYFNSPINVRGGINLALPLSRENTELYRAPSDKPLQ
ncbi:transporter substrate-binding domain-containing protein [Pseudomonas sp. R1-18]|uniref:transporter substrate-binding domain-containing protein n=1 Tax=Pseudomonas sp. R1-18 TaxID=1632772 RepID=UPI003DA93781